MPVRTKRLGGPSSIAAAGSVTLVTVPENRTGIVKYVTIRPAATPTGTVSLYIGTPHSTRAVATWTPGSGVREATYLVLHELEVLTCNNDTNVAVTVSVHGTLLDGDPV